MKEKEVEEKWANAMALLVTCGGWAWFKGLDRAYCFSKYIANMKRYESMLSCLPTALAVKCALLWCMKSLSHIGMTREEANEYLSTMSYDIVKMVKDYEREEN